MPAHQGIHRPSAMGIIRTVLFLYVLSVHTAPLYAQGGEYITDHKPTSVSEVDYIHDAVSRRVLNLANRLDYLFAEERVVEENNESIVQVNVLTRYILDESPVLRLSLKGRLVLPYLEDRVQLIFDSADRERDIKDDLRITDVENEDERSLFTGLRYLAKETKRSRISLDGGLRWRGGPVPFARVRGRRVMTFDPWIIRLTQTVFWFSDRGFGETTQLDFERVLDDVHFFRATPSATWSETTRGVDLRQRFTVFHQLAYERILAADLDIQAHTRPTFQVDKYEFTLRYRRPFYRPWLLIEVAPGIQFTRENNYDAAPMITLKSEILFGDVPRILRPF